MGRWKRQRAKPLATVLTLPESNTAPLTIRAKALVFHDPHSCQLLEHVERLARSDATVLVTGETGTGKELIARHIHTVSGRAGPFVAVNCGAFTETLIDAELFGHEAGAFTGATQARAGWFEAAQGGTLFLDEIGDLPMPLQVKLLRVLQERQVVRLGSRRAIPLDVRLVAATNIDLARAVAAKHFRADLYYRLSVAGVRLPPLHERRADIVPLAEHFIGVYRQRLRIGPVRLGDDAVDALRAYSWPGNIRELENVIHYALIVCAGEEVRREDLKLVPLVVPAREDAESEPRAESDTRAAAAAAATAAVPKEPPPDATARLRALLRPWLEAGTPDLLTTVEGALVHEAFAFSGRNQVRAARALGVTRNIVRTHLRRHGLLAGPEAAGPDDAGDAPEPSDAAGPSGGAVTASPVAIRASNDVAAATPS